MFIVHYVYTTVRRVRERRGGERRGREGGESRRKPFCLFKVHIRTVVLFILQAVLSRFRAVWRVIMFVPCMQGGRPSSRKPVETGTQGKGDIDYQWLPPETRNLSKSTAYTETGKPSIESGMELGP